MDGNERFLTIFLSFEGLNPSVLPHLLQEKTFPWLATFLQPADEVLRYRSGGQDVRFLPVPFLL